MRYFFYFLMSLGCVFSNGCINQEGFVVRGMVEGRNEGKAYAIRPLGKNRVDTLMMTDIREGKFLWKGKVEEITPVFLNVENAGSALVFLENGKTFDVVYRPGGMPQVKGGGESQKLSVAYDSIAREVEREYAKIESEVTKAYQSGDSAKIERFRKIQNKILQDNKGKQETFLYKHGNTFFALYDLAQKALGMHSIEVKARYDLCSDSLKATSLGKEVAALLPKLENLVVGKTVPDFVATTPEGKEVSLYSIKCKVKLIDFWASNCGVCREENQLNVPLYDTYHSQGFDVISYSLDRKKDAWLRAVREDKLPWTQVYDPDPQKANLVAKDFGVYYLPTTLLVDENNRIIALNVKNRDLVELLPKLLAEP